MIERPLSTRAVVKMPPNPMTRLHDIEVVVEITWNGAHTVNATLARLPEDAYGRQFIRSCYGRAEGEPMGVCSIGDYTNDAATLDDFLRCVRDFEQDPFNHPLWIG